MTRFLVIAALLAGCSKKSDPGPSCDQIVDHMLTVTKQQLTGHDNVELGNRKVMIEQCEQRKLTPAERKCMITVKDLSGFASCRAAKPPAAPTPVPAPAGSAS